MVAVVVVVVRGVVGVEEPEVEVVDWGLRLGGIVREGLGE